MIRARTRTRERAPQSEARAPGAPGVRPQPLDQIRWVHRDTLKPNNYNPNKVMAPELRLLKISILEDGWTQPIVINVDNEIVDGFHRWTVSGQREVYDMTKGMVPTVQVLPHNGEHQMMSTIRHNRARGTHGVLSMASIVQTLVDAGVSMEEIMSRLQMEEEEVIRLASRVGIPQSAIIRDTGFGNSWVPAAISGENK